MRALDLLRLRAFAATALAGALCIAGCGSGVRGGHPPGDNDAGVAFAGGNGTITIDPTDVTLDLVTGMAAPTASFTVTFHDTVLGDQDVSHKVAFALDDNTLGTIVDNLFTASDHGGTTRLVATYQTMSGPAAVEAHINVRMHATFGANFPDDTATACAPSAAAKVVYPADGVLLPPNLAQFEIHFNAGSGVSLYEVAFQNSVTDVRIRTACVPVTDTRAQNVSGGCVLAIDPHWALITGPNKGGDPIKITVRSTTDGTCASPSSNTPSVMVAEEDTAGAVYYWKSKFTPIGSGGDIWRKTFGNNKPEEKLTPDKLNGNFTNYPCWGCHSLSRDGSRMTVNTDDSDSDDEYGDTSAGLFDVASKTFLTTIGYAQGYVPGFQTFNNDHSLIAGTDGDGYGQRSAGGFGGGGATNVFYLWKGTDGTDATPNSVTVAMPGQRPTMPDWSLDNKTVVYVIPQKAGWSGHDDDAHIFGGSLWTVPFANGKFGRAAELLHSNGDNNYYPSISPDGQWVVYNHVDKQKTANGAIDGCTNPGSMGSCPNDSFSNPKARLYLMPPVANMAPIDLANANGSPHNAQVDVSNSWPRWSPFVQKYKSTQLLWITFSSTRDYGLRVRNHVPVNGQKQGQCYPADSAEDLNGSHGQAIPANCQQPQIWMAAINIGGGENGQNGNPSFPAFWLPYQDLSTHNHTAQWTANVAQMGGGCAKSGESCLAKPCCPNEGICLQTGKCGVP